MSGLVDGKLARPPFGDRCACSEYPDHPCYVEPFGIQSDPVVAWQRVVEIVMQMPRTEIEEQTDSYLRAICRTNLLRFTDVLEFRLDVDGRSMHVRSCSRVGIYDFGVNRRRVELLREQWNAVQTRGMA